MSTQDLQILYKLLHMIKKILWKYSMEIVVTLFDKL